MINFKREYIGLEQDRLLYPVSFTDKAKCNVYGRKKFITEAGEVQLSAHVFLISKDFWTFNAGQLDFTNYPNGIWNDYISIDIVEKDEYTAPNINFGSMGDITPENLQGLSDYISKHLSDLEKRIVEDYLFIDEGVSENIELPNLPENHFWVRKNGVIVGVNLDYLKADYEHFKNELWKNYESFNEKLQAALKKYYDDLELQMNNFFKDLIEKIREEAEKQLGLIAGAGGGLLHKIDQANHGFIFDPIVYENGVWKKATTTSGVDGIGVVISANTFFFLEAGEIEIPKGATDKDGQPLLDDEYYYMNEDGGTGFQKEEPVWFYQPLFHTRTHKGKLLANVSIDTMEDLRGQVVDTESGRIHGIALWGDIVPKFDTIEKLQKAFWLKEGEVVEVLGYYSPGDGAGHKRIIKAEDDRSGVQLSNNLWACIVHNGEVNVSWFGAKGDGVTDDTELILKSFSYANNKTKVLKFNQGVYICNKTIMFSSSKNLRVVGAGQNSTTIKSLVGGHSIFSNSTSSPVEEGIEIMDMRLENLETEGSHIFDFGDVCNNYFLENIRVQGGDIGIKLSSTFRGFFKNIFIRNCSTGIELSSKNEEVLFLLNFYNVQTQYCKRNLKVTGNSHYSNYNINFFGCDFERSDYNNYIKGADVNFNGCYFEELGEKETEAYILELTDSFVSLSDCLLHRTKTLGDNVTLFKTNKPLSIQIGFNNFFKFSEEIKLVNDSTKNACIGLKNLTKITQPGMTTGDASVLTYKLVPEEFYKYKTTEVINNKYEKAITKLPLFKIDLTTSQSVEAYSFLVDSNLRTFSNSYPFTFGSLEGKFIINKNGSSYTIKHKTKDLFISTSETFEYYVEQSGAVFTIGIDFKEQKTSCEIVSTLSEITSGYAGRVSKIEKL